MQLIILKIILYLITRIKKNLDYLLKRKSILKITKSMLMNNSKKNIPTIKQVLFKWMNKLMQILIWKLN